MKYITSLHAYDCLGSVVYACTVREYHDYEHGESHVAFDLRGSFPGVGIDDVHVWLRLLIKELSESI